MAPQTKGTDILQSAFPAPFDDRDNMIGVPEVSVVAKARPQDLATDPLKESAKAESALISMAAINPRGYPASNIGPMPAIKHLPALDNPASQVLGVDPALRAYPVVSLVHAVPQVPRVTPEAELMDTRLGAEGSSGRPHF